MTFNKNKTSTFILPGVLLALMLLTECGKKVSEGVIILSETTSDITHRNFINGVSWRYIPQSRIIAVDQSGHESKPQVLSGTFYSACSPDISPDGKLMAFSGQEKEGDPWQIWLMDLFTMKKKQVLRLRANCTDPAFLPGGRLVFSMSDTTISPKSGHSLYTCKTDGSDLRRITFSPHEWFASDILKDGRILASGRQIYPELRKQQFIVLRPDGTKTEIFYSPQGDNNLFSRPRETGNGRIIFVESSDTNAGKGELISIRYNRPLHSRVNLSGAAGGDFMSAFPEKSGKYLVTFRKSSSEKYSLCEFDPATGSISKAIYSDPGFNITDAVVVSPFERQRILPSEVDMQVKTGLIMCQDINVAYHGNQGKKSTGQKYSRIEIESPDSSLGVMDVAEDGSFYLKVRADSPFRIKVLDDMGNMVGEPCDWIWLRPNERRGCVGCHEDHEIAPENRIPLAVKSQPVALPVHIVKLKEKSVELE